MVGKEENNKVMEKMGKNPEGGGKRNLRIKQECKITHGNK